MLVDGGFSVEGDGHRFKPWGFDGGNEGHVSRLQLIGVDDTSTDLVSKVPYHRIRQDERLRSLGPCGGGYGDPLERSPDDVLDDVLDQLITPEIAFAEYGVAVTDGVVDQAATEAERSRRK
jgi:N-methylhydantoinase B